MPDKSRFLIATADERAWRTDRPVLFLGEWCRLPHRASIWEGLDSEVVPPYGWDEGQRDADYALIQDMHERLLAELGDRLNRFHGTRWSTRYWRILLGLWLHHCVSIVFNRWSTIHKALREHRIDGTVTLRPHGRGMCASESYGFILDFLSDEWDNALCGRILQGWTEVPYDTVEIMPATRVRPGSVGLRQHLKEPILGTLSAVSQMLCRDTDAVIIESGLPTLGQDVRLQLALSQIPTLRRTPPAPAVAPDPRLRESLRLDTGRSSDFENCIRTLIFELLPTCYLEGYRTLRATAEGLPWPRTPRVIFTSSNFDTDDVFKAWTASKVETGTPYVIGQHGANYGTSRFAPSELHEVATADRYLTWGWEDGNAKHHPTAAIKIIGLEAGDWDPQGGLLLVEVHRDPRSTPWDETATFKGYLEQQFEFVKRLPGPVRDNVSVRLHIASSRLGWREDGLWRKAVPGIRIDMGVGPIRAAISRSRLVVHSYNSTGILETLALNVPTLFFFEERHWPLRESARPYYDSLKRVGIFHGTPEDAAAKSAAVWEDVVGWWRLPEVQDARRLFCERFARMPDRPIQTLRDALLTVKGQGRGSTAS